IVVDDDEALQRAGIRRERISRAYVERTAKCYGAGDIVLIVQAANGRAVDLDAEGRARSKRERAGVQLAGAFARANGRAAGSGHRAGHGAGAFERLTAT